MDGRIAVVGAGYTPLRAVSADVSVEQLLAPRLTRDDYRAHVSRRRRHM
jgi:hypothetical protein